MTGTKLGAVILMGAGALLSLVGLMVGLLPHSAGYTDCGSGFAPNPNIVWTTECFGMTDTARTIGLVLLVPGILALMAGAVLAYAEGKPSSKPAASDSTVEDHAAA
jgi:hypothetical protein